MARLLDKYIKEVQPRLSKQLGRSNPLSLPRLTKIVVNMGVGQAAQDRKRLEEANGHLATITGQKPLTAFDDFVAQWKKLGGDKIIGEVNTWWKSKK